mmetsp:Transcript_53283/g.79153  ORF Transcript_53283/g.79153 Transcript_53283/m.79153 type:complete len:352 (+) Transcript_53283:132-1187(+)
MFTESQLKLIAIAPKVTAPLSILGSLLIIGKVLSSDERRSRVHHRLLFGMSICDIFQSFAYFLSTWPMPKDSSPFPYSRGTHMTCTIQGFFVQMGHSVMMYNVFLSLHYLISVQNNFVEIQLLRKLEPLAHVLAVGWPVLGGIIATLDDSMNIAGPVACWINSVPTACQGDDCIKGPRAGLWRWIFAMGTTFVAVFVATVAWIMLYFTVRQKEKCTATDAESRALKTLLRIVSNQAALYLGAFYFTWGIPLFLRVYQQSTGQLFFSLIVFFAIVMPSQGIFNAIIYLRPTRIIRRRSQPPRAGNRNDKRYGVGGDDEEREANHVTSWPGAEDYIESVMNNVTSNSLHCSTE